MKKLEARREERGGEEKEGRSSKHHTQGQSYSNITTKETEYLIFYLGRPFKK